MAAIGAIRRVGRRCWSHAGSPWPLRMWGRWVWVSERDGEEGFRVGSEVVGALWGADGREAVGVGAQSWR